MPTMRHEGKDPGTFVGTLDWIVASVLFGIVLALDYGFGARSYAAYVAWPLWACGIGLLLTHWHTVIRGKNVELWGFWAAALAHVLAAWHVIAVIKDVT
ncbi:MULTISPECIES: hypothetical protein [unclassified Streptomyces]|uniref:hypothetical protein n=1 Tax=unclassified Streptomyces TaxID=2593676 RepID=UPI0022547C14|nr:MULTISPECIES: hypothetical protein [unclassified Streptomyces]MCX5162484.1 hypothetical protein [Streptomyces sp. NBC_00305]MCX5221001.1 hypothetical protein [Streptomyces sp. NBC_00264]MCX5502711.1 hypothetical protein [Streptomyces sp. NBC_00052]MCX5548753.1 hypothetical protein [Streptomyces sp. NBC_00051]WSP47036.1 hypothetical protein OG348_14755 [Streptomyces sp. NBC_01243]